MRDRVPEAGGTVGWLLVTVLEMSTDEKNMLLRHKKWQHENMSFKLLWIR